MRVAVRDIIEHQRSIDDQLAKLYSESEDELAKLNSSQSLLTEKLDTINSSIVGLGIQPGDTGATIRSEPDALIKPGFWRKSGGDDENAKGNPRYILEVSRGGSAAITLSSSYAPVDTFLYLLSYKDNEVIAWNDDAGDRGFSRIIRDLELGRYVIVAATLKEGVNASYILTVNGVGGRLYSQ